MIAGTNNRGVSCNDFAPCLMVSFDGPTAGLLYATASNTGLLRGVTGVDNATSVETKGIEFSGEMLITDNWRAGINIVLLDAEYGAYANTQYSFKLASDIHAFVRAEWSYRSVQLSNAFALRYEVFPFIAPSYDVANLRAGLSRGAWSVTAYAENALQEDYFQNAYEKAFHSGVQVEPSTSYYGINFRYRFGDR